MKPQRTNDVEVPRDVALGHAQYVQDLIADYCNEIIMTGSIRRDKSHTADADMVVIPWDAPTLLNHIDVLAIEGKLRPALYSDGRKRWGSVYRGFSVDGFKVEIFIADEHNRGVKHLIRTGPGAANTYIMRSLQYPCDIRFKNQYVERAGNRISVPDERTMFNLLRMRYIPPAKRSIDTYKRYRLELPIMDSNALTFIDVPAPPVQQSMF